MNGEKQFWSNVARGDASACWEWQAHRNGGYGVIGWGGRDQKAHRVSWSIVNGPIPEGLCVCHRCDNPGCVNPAHLFLGTHADNMLDREIKGRANRPSFAGERNSQAKLTSENVNNILSSAETSPVLAKRYGVSASSIRRIKTRGWGKCGKA